MSFGSGRLAGLSCALALPVVASLALMSQQPAAAAALGPQVEVGEPANGYVGRLDISPTHAPAGTPVTLSAAGLPPGQEFQLVWNTASGAWKVTEAEYHGREFTPVAYEIAKAKTDQSGRLSGNFIAPDDNNFTGWMSSVTTKGAASFTIPATGGPGVHVIEIMHGELTFPYRNPEQNPAPGRPRFAFQFTVTDGAPVMPAPPGEQAQKVVRTL